MIEHAFQDREAGVIDQDVDGSELTFDRFQSGLQRLALRDVELQGHRGSTNFLTRRQGVAIAILVARENRDRRSRLRKAERNSAPDATVAASDDRDLAAQIECLWICHCASPTR